MVDTLESLREELGKVPLGLILGMDAFLGLTRWHRWEALFDLAHIVVMQRPGYRPELATELQSQSGLIFVPSRKIATLPNIGSVWQTNFIVYVPTSNDTLNER